MPKLKIANRFGIIPNKLLNNPNISWKAKGLFGYLQSKPEDWEFAVSRINKDATDGEKSTISGIKELENAGYLQRKKYQNKLGHWEIEYTLSDVPIADNRQQEIPIADNPSADNPSADNRQTNKERNTKKEIQIKTYIQGNEMVNELFKNFVLHRKQMKSEMTEVAINQAVAKVEKRLLEFTRDEVGFIISKSIESNWKGLFPSCLKEYHQAKKKEAQEAYHEKPEARKAFSF